MEHVRKAEQIVVLRLEQVVPWGRSAAEYAAMFALTPQDLRTRLAMGNTKVRGLVRGARVIRGCTAEVLFR